MMLIHQNELLLNGMGVKGERDEYIHHSRQKRERKEN